MAEHMQGQVSQVLGEIQGGDGLTMSGAGRLFPGHRGGKAVNPSTVFRWVTKGLTSPSGVVRLEAARVGSRWLTSAAAVARFVAALTVASTPSTDQPTSPTLSPAARQREADRAAEALIRAGA